MNRHWALAVAALLATAAASAQPAPAAAPTASTDAPLQCWWRTSAGAIRLGEIVEVTLTCAVLEADAVHAVPDESRLSVAAIQLTPFEIVGGTHPPAARAGAHRFFQYGYQLRIIDADVIGRDVKLPPVAIPYRVESRVGAGSPLSGRDQLHVMPQLAIRILSQVPADATDIRDAGDASLARIDALRFRASAYRMTAAVLGALGLVAGVTALLPLAARARGAGAGPIARVPDRVVLRQTAAALEDAGRIGAATDWNEEAVAEAHRAVRIVAATALAIGVRQRALGPAAGVPEHQLLVTHGLRRRRTAVTASITAATITGALDVLPASTAPGQRARLERLREILETLTRVQYGADPADRSALDESVRAARDLATEMARERLWSVRDWVGRAAPVRPER